MRQLRPCSSTAPSSTLIRFLRSQANNLCFFTPNALRDAPSRSLQSSDPRCPHRPSRARPFATTTRRHATLESTLFPVDLSTLRGRLLSPSHGKSAAQRWSSGAPWWELATRWKHKQREWPDKPPRDDPSSPFWNDGSTLLGRVKSPNELKLRCTELDESGKVTVVDGEFKKSELIARFGLLPRDLRKIDSSMLPSIIVRPTVILINLVHLRVLVRHDCVLVLDVYGSTASYAQSVFMYDLQGKLGQKETPSRAAAPGGGLPYEFRALEAVLMNVTSGLEIEFDGVRDPVVRVLRELEEDIDREKLRLLLIYSKKLGTFEQKARLVRDAIEGLLEDDGDLSTMYLTEHAQGKKREPEDHAEIEMLLESYHKVTDEIVESSATLVSEIRNTEEIVKAILDANRNALMLLDLKFSIGTLSMGSGAFLAALYGMNLKNFIEESDLGFWGISGVSLALAVGVCGYGLHKLRRVQRTRMWGEGGRSRRGSWRDVDPATGKLRLDVVREERMKRLKEAKREAWMKERCEEKGLPEVTQMAPAKTEDKH